MLPSSSLRPLSVLCLLAAVASAACGGASTSTPDPLISYQVECAIDRIQCTSWIPKNDASHVNDVSCDHEHLLPFSYLATMCFNSTAANRNTAARDACFKYCEGDLTSGLYPLAPDLGEPTFEHVTCDSFVKDMSESSIREAVPGECPPPGGYPTGTSGGGATTSVMCTVAGLKCLEQITLPSGAKVCSLVENGGGLVGGCFDPTVTSAEEYCRQSTELEFRSWHVNFVTPNACTPAPPAALTRLGIGAGTIGSVGLDGTTASLVAIGGHMTTTRNCDESGEFCVNTLNSLRIQLQDATLVGFTLHNPQIQLIAPVTQPIGQPLAPRVAIDGDVTGIGHISFATPASPTFTLNSSATTATLSGTINMLTHVNTVEMSQLTATFSVSGSTSSPNATCSNQTPQQQLLGFESASNWNSTTASVSLTSSPKTQGCFALSVGGSGFRTVNSAPFATPLSGTTGMLGLDVFIPPAQPNPYWLGAVQMHLSCPASNFFNQYIGQVELTGRPVGAFSTLQFPIPTTILNVLTASQSGASSVSPST